MLKTTDNNSGIYLLEIYARQSFFVKHKKFTGINFPSGWYYYMGSAQKNLISRISRHINKNKKLFWHIDFITSLETNIIKNVFVFLRKDKKHECILTKNIFTNFKLDNIIKGFGNSDCVSCPSHLLYSQKSIREEIEKFFSEAIKFTHLTGKL